MMASGTANKNGKYMHMEIKNYNISECNSETPLDHFTSSSRAALPLMVMVEVAEVVSAPMGRLSRTGGPWFIATPSDLKPKDRPYEVVLF